MTSSPGVSALMPAEELALRVDASLGTPAATKEELNEFIRSLADWQWAAVMVEPAQVRYARPILAGLGQRLVTVLAYPLGAYTTQTKLVQAEQAIEDGADELDVAMDLSAFRSADYRRVVDDLTAVRRLAGDRVVKAIYYSAVVTDEEAIRAAELSLEAGIAFLKTNPGYGNVTTTHHIEVIKDKFGDHMQVMASGGVRTGAEAAAMLAVGADRIATSSPLAVIGVA